MEKDMQNGFILVIAIIGMIILSGVISATYYFKNQSYRKDSTSSTTGSFTQQTATSLIPPATKTTSIITPETTSQLWQIKLEKTAYSINELTLPTPGPSQFLPRARGPVGIPGRLFAPLNFGDSICRFINYNESMFLEKKEGEMWVRLCDQFIPTDTQRQVYCKSYNPSEGVGVYGILFPTKACTEDNLDIIEAGVYRLHSIFYTECNSFDQSIYADPAQCGVKKDIYSSEIVVK